MKNWLSGPEITKRYIVSEETLLAFASRGNLPCRRLSSTSAFEFDEGVVARFFRVRPPPGASGYRDIRSKGGLGAICLGEALGGEDGEDGEVMQKQPDSDIAPWLLGSS